MSSNEKISAQILAMLASGKSVEDAINIAFVKSHGPNAYEKIAAEIYEALRS